MAESPWVPVAGQAMRLGLGLYFVPLAFVANPYLLHPGIHLPLALWAFFKVAIGLWLMSKSLIGRAALPARLAYFLAGVAVIFLFGTPLP